MKFIDLFCGIGGIRLGLETEGHECVYSNDFDKHAAAMYKANFGENCLGDITKVNPFDIPDFDILTGGFPCQPFSKAGQQKGFEDTRGTLFFDVCRIIEVKKPKIVLLENVKNLKAHDGGKTFKVIYQTLENLGYNVSYKILNANDFGVPQNRERLIIIGYSREVYGTNLFDFSKLQHLPKTCVKDILEDIEHEVIPSDRYTLVSQDYVRKSGLIYAGHLNEPCRANKGIRMNGEGAGNFRERHRIYDANGTYPTVVATRSGHGLIKLNDDVFRLTMKEYFRLFGFPDDFIKVGPISQLYKRIGNSVCVPMFAEIARQLRIKE